MEEWKVPVESDTLEAQSPYDLMKAMRHCIVRMELLQPYEIDPSRCFILSLICTALSSIDNSFRVPFLV